MNLFEPVLESVRKFLPSVFRVTDQEFINGNRLGRIFGVGGNETTGKESQIYKNHPWTYSAINAIARNISGVPFVFMSQKGRMSGDHKFVELFEKPNRWEGLGQFLESLVGYWHLYGKAIVILDRSSESEVPKEMVVDDPTRFEPKFSKTTGRLIGWVKHKDNGEMVPLRLHQVLYIKFWNPDSPIDGLSPISAAANGIEGDLLASQFNTNFFQNSGSPAGVIEMEGNLTDEQFNRLVRQYEDRHGGTQNAHKVLILEANAKFKQSSFTQKDMDFLNQKKWNRDETLAVFNVPKMEVGVWDDINFAIAKVQAREFWLKNLIPKMKLIEWVLWSQLFEKIGQGRIWAEFDTTGIEALQDEFNEKIKVARTMWEMGYPLNQINRKLALGMPENSWQNAAYVPVNMTPVGVDEDGTPVLPDTSNPGQDPLVPSATGSDSEGEQNEGGDGKPPQPQAAPPGSSGPPPQTAMARTLKDKLKNYFYFQRKRQLKLTEKNPLSVLGLSDENDTLVDYIGDLVDVRKLEGLNEWVEQEKLTIVTLNFGDRDRILKDMKDLYNSIEKQCGKLAEKAIQMVASSNTPNT